MINNSLFFKRLINLTKNYSFLLFGARGTGKSSILAKEFHFDQNLYINLFHEELS